MKQMNNQVLTTDQLAEFLQLNKVTIYKLLQKREIPAFRVAGQWRFLRKDVDAWMESMKTASDTMLAVAEPTAEDKKYKTTKRELAVGC